MVLILVSIASDALFYTDFEENFGRLSHSRGVGGRQWKRGQGETDSAGTGPTGDITDPEGTGMIIHTESTPFNSQLVADL